MSSQITTAFVQQYRANVMHLSQQKGSRLRNTVSTETVAGESGYFDRIGASAAVVRTTRHGDTPLMNTPHSRRKLDLADYEWADLCDKQDKVRMLIDPQSEYAMVGANAMGRSMDDVVITAANGTAKTGKDGSGSAAFPAAQQIAAGGGGLTLAKLIATAELFNSNEVDPDDNKTMVIGPKQVTDLLNLSQIQSVDTNRLRALVDGSVVRYMGFDFIMSNRLNVDGSSDRLCLAYTKSAVTLGIGEDVVTKITERDDKSYSTQVYLRMSLGAVRMEEAQVVEIACVEG